MGGSCLSSPWPSAGIRSGVRSGPGAQDLAHKGSVPPSAPVNSAEAPESMPLLGPFSVFPEFS